MTEIEEKPLTPETAYQELQIWFQEKRDLGMLKFVEHKRRVKLSDFYFTAPREGTNRMDLGGGYDLKMDYSYNYKVDEPALENVTPAQIKKLKLTDMWDALFVYKPELSISQYRKLTAEQKLFVDQLLDIKPGSPQMDIVKRAEEAAPAPAITGLADTDDVSDVGQYYEDGEGQWWVSVIVADEETGEDVFGWEECANPNAAVKPKRAPRKSKA